MFNFRHKTRSNRRDGISIIEVLTSMAVATIGVFGVMVMIPFAVKQSQTGLDNDAANALGRNASEEIQIQGILRAELINRPDPADLPTDLLFDGLKRIVIRPAGETFNRHFNLEQIPAPWNAPTQGVLHLDPIGFASDTSSAPLLPFGLTTFNADDLDGLGPMPPVETDPIVINSGSLTNFADNTEFPVPPGLTPISLFEANRLFRSMDDMVYEVEPEGLETAPPQPIFNVVDGDTTIRQSLGRISWSTFMVPEKSPVLSSSPVSRFKTYTVVYRDRFISPSTPVTSCYQSYRTSMAGGGYTATTNQIFFDTDIDPDATPVNTEEVVQGSWVMLVNRIPEPAAAGGTVNAGNTAADNGFRTQISFARVTRVNDTGTVVSVDGGPFEFVGAGVLGAAGGSVSTNTYMVHIKNAVSVYERSITVER